MMRTGQVVLIKVHVFCQVLKGHNLQFLEVMSLYYDEAGMRIERRREDCYDLSDHLCKHIGHVARMSVFG